jgi:hypothetical protein
VLTAWQTPCTIKEQVRQKVDEKVLPTFTRHADTGFTGLCWHEKL